MSDQKKREFRLIAACKGETEITLQRKFRAPKQVVFECFTDPKLLTQWLGCGMGETTRCEIDPTVGGVWHHMMKMKDGQIFHTFGQTLEFDPQKRFVRSYVYNVPFIREHICTETATFSENGGVTTVDILIRHLNRESRDGHFNSGLEMGAGISYDALDSFLESKK